VGRVERHIAVLGSDWHPTEPGLQGLSSALEHVRRDQVENEAMTRAGPGSAPRTSRRARRASDRPTSWAGRR
jgi:hypothetical protein